MKIMKQLWEEKGYASLNLTAQNLRDTVARYEKKQKSFEASSIAENQQQTDVGQENGRNMGHIAVDEAIVTAEININN